MPTYELKCDNCHLLADITCKIADRPQSGVDCPDCSGTLRRQVEKTSVRGEEAAWLRSTAEVADPDGGQHCQEFIQDPTRSNYRAWMKGEGLRPMEPGEEKRKVITDKERKESRHQTRVDLSRQHMKRCAITVKS